MCIEETRRSYDQSADLIAASDLAGATAADAPLHSDQRRTTQRLFSAAFPLSTTPPVLVLSSIAFAQRHDMTQIIMVIIFQLRNKY